MSKAKPKKIGRLSKEEWAYIQENADKMTVEQMGDVLQRRPEYLDKWIRNNLNKVPMGRNEVTKTSMERVRSSPQWAQLRKELSHRELEYFEHKFEQLLEQFNDDVLPTEEMQMFLLIKTDILINRNMSERKRLQMDVVKWEKRIRELNEKKSGGDELDQMERHELDMMSAQITATQAVFRQTTAEYTKLVEKHTSFMKELKGTRDQRIQANELNANKETLLDYIKILMEEKTQQMEGRELELVKLAVANQKAKLIAEHKFMDGIIDSPLLTAEQ